MTEWREELHPRDNEGKFTYKNGESSTSKEDLIKERIRKENKEREELEKRAEILYKNMKVKNKNENFEEYTPLLNHINTNLGGDILEKMKNIEKKEIDNRIFSETEKEKAKAFIQMLEGFNENAYQDTGGVWTIGYGKTENVKAGDKMSKEEAEAVFLADFNKYKNSLKEVKIPLSTNEKVALVSFIYNVGIGAFKNSTLLQKLNQGDKKGAAEEFDKWIYDNKVINKGLINRRKQEKNLFLTPDD